MAMSCIAQFTADGNRQQSEVLKSAHKHVQYDPRPTADHHRTKERTPSLPDQVFDIWIPAGDGTAHSDGDYDDKGNKNDQENWRRGEERHE